MFSVFMPTQNNIEWKLKKVCSPPSCTVNTFTKHRQTVSRFSFHLSPQPFSFNSFITIRKLPKPNWQKWPLTVGS